MFRLTWLQPRGAWVRLFCKSTNTVLSVFGLLQILLHVVMEKAGNACMQGWHHSKCCTLLQRGSHAQPKDSAPQTGTRLTKQSFSSPGFNSWQQTTVLTRMHPYNSLVITLFGGEGVGQLAFYSLCPPIYFKWEELKQKKHPCQNQHTIYKD